MTVFTIHLRTIDSAPKYARIRVEAPSARAALSEAIDIIRSRGDAPIDEAPGDPRVDPRRRYR